MTTSFNSQKNQLVTDASLDFSPTDTMLISIPYLRAILRAKIMFVVSQPYDT